MSAPRHPALLVALGLAAALAVVHANVVFGGRSLVATDNYNILRFPPSEIAYGPGFVDHMQWHERGLLLWAGQYDPGAAWCQWEPGAHVLRGALARGEAPFWNPYVGAGAPEMANLNETHFFPPYLAVVLLFGSTSLARNVYALALLWSAGLFTYLFLRRHELSHVGAAFGGLAFMLSGTLNQMIVSHGGQTVACLPFTLWLTRVFLDRGDARGMALLAAGYAAVSLSSSPPLLLLQFGLAAAYAAAAALRERRLGLLLRYLAAAALALGLVAFYYLPAAKLIALSQLVAALYSGAAGEHFPPRLLLQLLSPDLYGGGAFYTRPAATDPYPWQLQACGVSALFGALLAGGGGARRRAGLAVFALVALVAVATKVVGWPPMEWLFRLPALRSAHFSVYASFLLHFLVAALAGVGCDRLWRRELGSRQPLIASLLLCAALAAVYLLARQAGLVITFRPSRYTWIYRYTALWLAVLGLSTAALVALRGRGRGALQTLALAAGFGILLGEGVLNLSFPRQRRFDVWRHPPPHVRALQELADGRRFANYYALPANAHAAFGLFGLDSLMTFNAERMNHFYARHFGGRVEQFLRQAQVLPPETLLDRAGIGLLAVRNDFAETLGEAERRGYVLRHRDDYASVLSRPGGLRYLVTPSYRLLPERAALDQVHTGSATELLVEEAPGFPPREFDPRASVRVEAFRNNAYRLAVGSPGPALLYSSESHMPGWEARVNGRPARILAANYAFRAVEVPAGSSEVTFRYVPPGFRAGLAVSIVSVLFCSLLALRRSVTRTQPPQPA